MSDHLKDYVKLLFEQAGLTILPDMKGPVESRNGKTILAQTFKMSRPEATVEGVKRLLENSNWTAFAVYQVTEADSLLYIRGHAE